MNDGGENIGWTSAGEWISYSIKVDKPGTYFAELRVESGSTTGGGSKNILINDENRLGTIKIASTGGWGTFKSIYPGKFELKATDTQLKYSCVTDGFNIGRLILWPQDTIVPSSPTAASRSISYFTVLLKWYKSTDNDMVSRYVVYLNNDSVKSITDSTYTFLNLKASTDYTYKVVAVDKQGNRSEPLTGKFTTLATGIDDMEENMHIYPNPFSGEVVLEGLSDRQAQIEIYNALGQPVYK